VVGLTAMVVVSCTALFKKNYEKSFLEIFKSFGFIQENGPKYLKMYIFYQHLFIPRTFFSHLNPDFFAVRF
jgi:hypothetical protein